MTLIRWKPVRDISRWSPVTDLTTEFLNMQRDIDRMFDRFRGDAREVPQGPGLWPSVDVVENDNDFVVHVELPGVRKDDVKITVADGILTIRGEKKQEAAPKGDNFHMVERCFGSFERTFNLPSTVQSEKIDANFLNGILTLTIPKAEQAKVKEIEVKVK
jgi:HSP20 family protein